MKTIMSSWAEGCIASAIVVAGALVYRRWISKRKAMQGREAATTDDNRSSIGNYDVESWGETVVEFVASDIVVSDIESGGAKLVFTGDDIESRGASRLTSNRSLRRAREQIGETPFAISSERSGSLVTIRASSPDEVSLLGSSAGYNSWPTSSIAHSLSTRGSHCSGKYDDQTAADNRYPESAAVVAPAVTTAESVATRGSVCRTTSSFEGESLPLSSPTLSLSMHRGSSPLPSQSSSDLRRGSNDSNTGGSGNGLSDVAGYEFDGDGFVVPKDDLVAALRRASIMTSERVQDQGLATHGDPQQSVHASNAARSFPRRSGDSTLSTASLNSNGSNEAEEQGRGQNAGVAWDRPIDFRSQGSMLGVEEDQQCEFDPALAKSRTDRLVDILRTQRDLKTAVQDIYLSQHCNLDLSASDDNGDLVRDKVIGTGCYGRVSVVRHADSGRTFALKELAEEAPEEHRQVASNEIEVYLCLESHPNIPKVVAVDSALRTMPILMESGHCDMVVVIASTLVSIVHKIKILHDAACGLLHVHNSGGVHRDVKAGNVIVMVDERDGSATGKIADFGFTCEAGDETEARMGTPGYFPPELLRESIEAGPENDVFSFGVLILETLILKDMWENNLFAHSSLLTEDEKADYRGVAHDDVEGYLKIQCAVVERTLADGSFAREIVQPENLQEAVPYGDAVCGWLQACLCRPPDLRPSMADVVGMLQCLTNGVEPLPMAMLY